MEKIATNIAMKMARLEKFAGKKVCLVAVCLAALSISAGCGNKGASETKSPQEVNAFKGHQPTPEQLQAAMPKGNQPPSGQPAPSKP